MCESVCATTSMFRENGDKKGRGGFRTWSALLPMGLGDNCVLERLCVCVCVCVHISRNKCSLYSAGPLPWLQGFIALKNSEHTEHLVTVTSHWQSCRLNQTHTQKWCDDDERRCKAVGEQLFNPGKSHRVQLFCHKWWKDRARHFQLQQTVGFYYCFMSVADSHLLHAERTFEQQQPETHFPTTHADQGAIKLEQPTALGLSVWPEKMCSGCTHWSPGVFSRESEQRHRKWWETTVDHTNSLNLWSGFNNLGQEQQRRLCCWQTGQ